MNPQLLPTNRTPEVAAPWAWWPRIWVCVCHPYPKSVKTGPVRVTPEVHRLYQGAGTWESLQKVPSFHSTPTLLSTHPPLCNSKLQAMSVTSLQYLFPREKHNCPPRPARLLVWLFPVLIESKVGHPLLPSHFIFYKTPP